MKTSKLTLQLIFRGFFSYGELILYNDAGMGHSVRKQYWRIIKEINLFSCASPNDTKSPFNSAALDGNGNLFNRKQRQKKLN